MIQDKVRKFIFQHNLLRKGARVLVGVSGGADSVALLIMLKRLGYDIVATHCNFHLRGDESLRDEKFVADLCNTNGIKLIKIDFDTQTYAHDHHISIEMAARNLRYDFFEQTRQENNCEAIAVAHHKDDNAETILLNLMRGTGIKGLCGIQPKNDKIIRPFLCLQRSEITDWLADIEQTFVTDSSNLVADVERNKIRLKLIPLMKELKPASISNLLRSAENMQEAFQVYNATLKSCISKCLSEDGGRINKFVLMQTPSPISVLHELLSPLGYNRTQLYNILSSIQHVGNQYESATHILVVSQDYLELANKEEFTTSHKNIKEVEDLLTLKTVDNTPEFRFDASPSFAYFDADKLKDPLTIRLAQQGDAFVPFGMKGHKLISDFLTDLKVNTIERKKQWVLLSGNEIAWVIGRRASNKFRIDKNTKRIIIAHIK